MISAKIKTILSGDTLILTPLKSTTFPPPERVVTLTNVREDPISKKALRSYVGRTIKFRVDAKSANREFGDGSLQGIPSLRAELLRRGMLRLRDADREEDEIVEAEGEARRAERGIWAHDYTPHDTVSWAESAQPSEKLPFVVDRVISGDRVIGVLDDTISGPFLLAGVRCARTDDESEKQKAYRAVDFVESKLLGRELHAKVVGESQSGLPIVLIEHPSGNNIHEKLLEAGLAEVVDWHSQMVGANMMGILREAERKAKNESKEVTLSKVTSSLSKLSLNSTFSAVVVSVISGDTYTIDHGQSTVQLASIRAPKDKALSIAVKEHCRKALVGKTVTVHVDAYKPPNNGYDGRFLVRFSAGEKDFGESLVARGYASVIRHSKATADERASNWDKLIELEAAADPTALQKLADTISTRIVDASESAAKARAFLNGFARGRVSGYHVDYVSSASRVKLFNPRTGTRLTLVLGGVANDKSDEAQQYVSSRLLQHSVEFEAYDVDKTGAFIGNVYVGKVPFQAALVAQGLVKLHPSVSANPEARTLEEAEKKARSEKKGLWRYDVEEKEEKVEADSPIFMDVEVTDVSREGVLSFRKATDGPQFALFQRQFHEYHSQTPSSSSALGPVQLSKMPKTGDVVCARFSETGKYYRARVKALDRVKGTVDVVHVDYGNVDTVTVGALRALPAQFGLNTYPAFAHTTTLQGVEMPPEKPNDYLSEAVYVLDELTVDREIVLQAVKGEKAEYDSVVYDAEKTLEDIEYSINKELVERGWGIVRGEMWGEVERRAREERRGCWEMGDVRE